MSGPAKRRLDAIGKQLSPADANATFEDIPLIKKVAPDSDGPRLKGKVAIITGKWNSQIQNLLH